jgi:uncharacterized membrane protein
MSGLAIGGHPLHPILGIVPLALIACAAALDGYALARPDAALWEGARWSLIACVLTGAVVAIPGVRDLLGYPPAARGVPLRHGLVNGAFLAAALVSWALRAGDAAPSMLAVGLAFAALGLSIAGWRVGRQLTASPSR